MQIIAALISGLVFGVGLVISGMVNPAKVLNFLDIFGTWDPSLAFVMGGAILVTLPGFWLLKGWSKPLFAELFQWPTRQDLDKRLLSGATLFGVGWGLIGLCPGPAITGLSLGLTSTFIAVAAMIAGMWIAKLIR